MTASGLLVLLSSSILLSQASLAQEHDNLTVVVDQTYYNGVFPVIISGKVPLSSDGSFVTVLVLKPDNSTYKKIEVPIGNGSYSYEMRMDEYDLPQGYYTVRAEYSDQMAETTFYFAEDRFRERIYNLTVENGNNYTISYSMVNGRLYSITADREGEDRGSGSIVLNITSVDDGEIRVTLPKKLIKEVFGYDGFSGYFIGGDFRGNLDERISSCDSILADVDFENGTRSITIGQDPEWTPARDEPRGFAFQEYLDVHGESISLRGVTNAEYCDFLFIYEDGRLHINVKGPVDEGGFMELWIPSLLLGGDLKVLADDKEIDFDIIEQHEDEEEEEESGVMVIAFQYDDSARAIDIIGSEAIDFPFILRDFSVVRGYHGPLQEIEAGDELIVIATVEGTVGNGTSVAYIVQVLDERGVAQAIIVTNKTFSYEPHYEEYRAVWRPAHEGKYTVEGLIWQSQVGKNGNTVFRPLADKAVTSVEVNPGHTNPDRIINVSNDEADSFSPMMAAQDNDVYLLWHSRDRQITDYDAPVQLRFARSVDGGATFEPAVELASNSVVGSPNVKDIVVSGSNVYIAFLGESSEEQTYVFFVQSSDGGATFNDQVSLSNGSFASNIDLVAEGGHVYVVWQQEDDAGNSSIALRSSADNGTTFEAPRTVSGNEKIATSPTIATNDGNVYLLWHSSTRGDDSEYTIGTEFTHSADHASTFSEPVRLFDDVSGDQSLLQPFDGGLYVVSSARTESVYYNRVYDSGDVFVVRSNNNGTSFGQPVNISNSPGESAPSEILMFRNDSQVVYVLYADEIFEGANIYVSKSVDGGKTFTEQAERLLGYGSFGLDLAKSHDNVFLLWSGGYFEQHRQAGRLAISSIVDDGQRVVLGHTTTLIITGYSPYWIQLEVPDEGGKLYVMWQDYSSGNPEILFTNSHDGGKTFHDGIDTLPVADAGPDLVVDEGGAVVLNASRSYDPENQDLAYHWNHVGGVYGDLSAEDEPIVTYTVPLVDSDTNSTIALTVDDGINGSFPDYINVLIRNVENHIALNIGGQAVHQTDTADFDAGEYIINVRIFAYYDYDASSLGININEDSFVATLTISDDFESDPDFDEIVTPVKIVKFEILGNSTQLSYTGDLVDMPGTVYGVLTFEEPIDFHGLASKGLPNVISRTMTVEVRGTVFDNIL